MPDKLTPETVDRMVELRKEGLSTREIKIQLAAEGTEVSVAAVSRHLRQRGIMADETITHEATQARVRAARAKAYERAIALLEDAENARERAYAPAQHVVNGPDGAQIIVTQEPSVADLAKLLGAIERLVTQAHKLIDSVSDDGTENARNLLTEILEGFKGYAEAHRGLLDGDPNSYTSDYDIAADPNHSN